MSLLEALRLTELLSGLSLLLLGLRHLARNSSNRPFWISIALLAQGNKPYTVN
jgi:hypothetical protein